MFRHILSRGIQNSGISLCRKYSQIVDKGPKPKWDLCAAVLVERVPVVTKTPSQIEKDYQLLLSQIEFETSLKSNHELQHDRDLLQAERIKKGQAEVDLDDTTAKQTAQDLKDMYVEELNKFEFAPRITEDDKNNNIKSINRQLEDNLYLLVEQKLGNNKHMILPQGKRQEGETLRQTAERVLRENCGEKIKVTFYGNAPCGFHKYKYPIDQRKDSVGAKVFFFRSVIKDGNVDEKITPKFEWLDRSNILQKLRNPYADSVGEFLY